MRSSTRFTCHLRNTIPSILMFVMVVLALAACADLGSSEWQTIQDSAQREAKAGNAAEAEKLFLSAIEKAVTFNDQKPHVTSLTALSDFYDSLGQSEKCSVILMRAISIGEKQLKDNGETNKDWRFLTARAALALANIYRDRGSYAQSEALYERARTLAGDSTSGAPQLAATIRKEHDLMSENRRKSEGTLDAMLLKGQTYPDKDRFRNKSEFDKLWLRCEKIELGPKSEETETTLRQLCDQARELFGVRESRYRFSIQKLYIYYCNQHDWAKAEALVRDDLKEFASLERLTQAEAERDPEKLNDIKLLCVDLNYLSDLAARRSQYNKSIALRKRALEIDERWHPTNLQSISTRKMLGDIYADVKKFELAMNHYERALYELDSFEKHRRPSEDSLRTRVDILLSMSNLDAFHGSFQQASKHLGAAERIFELHPNLDPDYKAVVWKHSAALAKRMGDKAKAKRIIDKALAYWAKNKAEEPYFEYLSTEQAGAFSYYEHDYETARKYFSKCMQIIRNSPAMRNRNQSALDTMRWLGRTELYAGRVAAAERFYREAQQKSLKDSTGNHALDVALLIDLGLVKSIVADFDGADPIYRRAVALADEKCVRQPGTRWSAMIAYADNEINRGRFDTAHDAEDRALAIALSSPECADLVAQSYGRLASLSCAEGEVTKARSYLKKSEESYEEVRLVEFDIMSHNYMVWEHSYWLQNDKANADAYVRKAKKIFNAGRNDAQGRLYDWDFYTSMRMGVRPLSYAEVNQSRIVKTARMLKNINTGFLPACRIRHLAVYRMFEDKPAEVQQLDQIACALRDAELKKRPVRASSPASNSGPDRIRTGVEAGRMPAPPGYTERLK